MLPWDFKVQKKEDLLIWADLWEDHGRQDFGCTLRTLWERDRWPGKEGVSRCWYLVCPSSWAEYPNIRRRRSSLCGPDFGVPHWSTKTTIRRYPSEEAAFLDLLVCKMIRARLYPTKPQE